MEFLGPCLVSPEQRSGSDKREKNLKNGTTWIILGVLFIFAALGLTGYNLYDSARADKAAVSALEAIKEQIKEPVPLPDKLIWEQDEAVEIRYPDYFLDPTKELPKVTIDGTDYIGNLVIPEIDLDLPIAAEWSYDILRRSPGRFMGSPYMNDFIICAHNYSSFFGALKYLVPGDQVFFTDMDGNCFEYKVVEIETLDKNAIKAMVSGKWDLTLFTCTIGAKSRVTVRCELVDD